ncbi:MAG: DUF3027 domain-containing protein [Actinobacteria bacterium]|nr:DUF3027 domain-containing protein [Actinomycetota bacterium]
MTDLDQQPAADLDPALASAVDLARTAVLEVARDDQVGEHLGVVPDAADASLASHRFACTNRAYVGWHWAVTLSTTPGTGTATVCEVVLLPGDGALLAPAWVPWNERVRPGDLSPGDLHPTPAEDPRLEPGLGGGDALEEVDDPASPYGQLRPEQWEIGLGRERVLSVHGRDLAVERWYAGDRGPSSPMAKAAPAHCSSCGFLMPIGGAVGQVFGVCANPFGADGQIVAFDYGCGAHSSVREIEGTGIPVTEVVVDEYGFVEVHARVLAEPLPDQLVPSQLVIGEEPVDLETDADAAPDPAQGEDAAAIDDVAEAAEDDERAATLDESEDDSDEDSDDDDSDESAGDDDDDDDDSDEDDDESDDEPVVAEFAVEEIIDTLAEDDDSDDDADDESEDDEDAADGPEGENGETGENGENGAAERPAQG